MSNPRGDHRRLRAGAREPAVRAEARSQTSSHGLCSTARPLGGADSSVWRWSTPKDLDVWIMPLCPGLVGALAGLAAGVGLMRAFHMNGAFA